MHSYKASDATNSMQMHISIIHFDHLNTYVVVRGQLLNKTSRGKYFGWFICFASGEHTKVKPSLNGTSLERKETPDGRTTQTSISIILEDNVCVTASQMIM